MPDFLLEIGCEEIPARMLDPAWKELGQKVLMLLARESLFKFESGNAEYPELIFRPCATPRRLSIMVPGIATSQPDVQERLIGPATKIAFKDGKPTPAAEAFARKAGIDVAKLETVTTPKGEYLSATVTKKGRRAAEVLTELLPKE